MSEFTPPADRFLEVIGAIVLEANELTQEEGNQPASEYASNMMELMRQFSHGAKEARGLAVAVAANAALYLNMIGLPALEADDDE